jgi:iron complex transport system substrate-binding protein
LLVLVVLCSLLLTACQPATTTPTPATSLADATDSPAITVLGVPYTLAQLQALEQVTATAGDRTATGVGLLALLDAATDTLPETIVLVASDGYSANVAVAELDASAVLGYTEDGKLDTLIPTVAKSSWVRDVVEITAPEEPSAAAEPDAKLVALDEPLELTDAAGRTLTLTALPHRIIVVGSGAHMSLHMLYMFDEGRQRLIATESRAATASDFLPLVDPAFSDVPTLAANPNVEQIAAMAPDLVIIKGIVENATATGLAQVGIPVLYVDLETMDAFFRDLANIGAVLGNPARAEEIATFYRSRLDKVDAALAGVQYRPASLLVSYSERGGEVAVKVPAAAWMQTAEVVRAGGEAVWLDAAAPTDGWTVTNFEQIAQWNPEKLFVIVDNNLEPRAVIDALKADANWAALQAVQNDELYAFPRDIFGWDQPEPRWILGVQWLATRLHPTIFARDAVGGFGIDIDAEVRAWFRELYGMDDARYEADILPVLEMNVD